MQLKRVMTASVAALAIGLAAPAVAQDSSTNEAGPGSADNNTSVNVVDGLDLLSNNSAGNGDNRDNDQSMNDSNNDNSVSDGLDLLSNNGNGDNRDNDQSTTNASFDLLSNNGNGNNRDNEVENYGSGSASRGGEVEDNGNNRDNENYGSWSASRGGEIEDSNNTGNSDAEDSYNDNSGQAEIVATQVLLAVNSNSQLDEVADFDGEDDTSSSVGYNSGDQSVNGNSFSAFAGILNQAWNTGLNANVQAATNIAAQGTVTFGDSGGAGDGGAGGGD